MHDNGVKELQKTITAEQESRMQEMLIDKCNMIALNIS